MIPRLYEADERSFDHLGLGGLPETKSCFVTEERNGQFELEMVYPMDGAKFNLLQPERIIYAPHDDSKTRQPFRIYKISRTMNGDVTIYARHISYDLSKMTVKPFSASSVAQAMAGLKTNTIGEQPFTFWTDKSTVANFKVEEPSTVRSRLGGVQGSILDVFGGGEYEWDHFTVRLRQNRGADNGVSLRFGKNLTDLVSEEDSTNVYTSCVPFWRKENTVVMLEDFVVHSEYEDLFDNAMCIPLDLSSELTSEDQDYVPTTAELREAAEAHMNRNLAWIITQSISAQFVALWQTEEFKKTALVQRLKLCDTVWALHPKLGVNASAKVIRTVYDVLLERYSSIEIGEARTDLNGTLVTQRDIEKTVEEQKSAVQLELEHALDLMSGASGGNVVIRRNAAGNPYEILIMDTDDITTAVNVLRLNMNGIAFSQSGYNGPFTTAWTIDSHFVADFITAGTFNGNLIKAGIIQDAAGVNYWNMTTGEFQLTPAAKIKTGTDSYVALSEYIGGIADEYVTELEGDLQAQIDSKIDTFYQSADPSTGWTAEQKAAHTGDLWYKTTDNTTWRWSGTAWQEQEVPAAVFDEIDGKSAIFYGTTSQTYTGVQTGDYLVDSSNGATYRWSGTAWVKQTDYAAAIATAMADLEEDLQTQIDGKIDTFYQETDPSTNWTTEQKTAHTGDLWYKTSDSSTWRWSGSAWQEQSVPDEVFDAIDGKSTIFYGTTSGTYTGVQTGDYLVDSASGKTYRWNGSSWVVQTDYASAISDAIGDLRDDLEAQIEDGKIETFYQSADPSTNWTTEQKTAHAGDLWYKTSDSSTWRWSGSAWQEQSVPDEVFDAIDGKSTIFYGTTSGTYTGVQKGDYLVDSTTGSTYRYTGSAWTKVTDYSTAISNLDSSLDQEEVFNRLTGNKTQECIRLVDGHLYINASWINSGTMTANLIKAGILKSQDSNENFSLNMTTGEMLMKKGSIEIGSSTGTYYFKVSSSGALQWKSTYSEMTSDGQLACSRVIITTAPQTVDNYGTYHADIRGSTMKIVNDAGDVSWCVNPKYGMRIYDLYGYVAGSILGRDQLRYTRNTTGLNLGSSTRVVVSAANGLRFDDGSNGRIRIDDYNGKCGINQDEYGIALFNQKNNNNCFVRCNPGGTVDISAPNGFYVNGVKVGS